MKDLPAALFRRYCISAQTTESASRSNATALHPRRGASRRATPITRPCTALKPTGGSARYLPATGDGLFALAPSLVGSDALVRRNLGSAERRYTPMCAPAGTNRASNIGSCRRPKQRRCHTLQGTKRWTRLAVQPAAVEHLLAARGSRKPQRPHQGRPLCPQRPLRPARDAAQPVMSAAGNAGEMPATGPGLSPAALGCSRPMGTLVGPFRRRSRSTLQMKQTPPSGATMSAAGETRSVCWLRGVRGNLDVVDVSERAVV